MNMTYNEWLLKKFREWEDTKSGRQSVSAFARHLNVKQSSLSKWMSGAYPPGEDNLLKIASKLGFEIYGILGIDPPITISPPVVFHADHPYTYTELAAIGNEIEEALDAIPGLSRSQRQEKMIELYKQRGFTLLSKR